MNGKAAILKFVVMVFLLPFAIKTEAQTITFYKDVEPIFRKKCFHCHTKNQNDFLFTTYTQVRNKSASIKYVVENGIMPPWPADNEYKPFKHSRSLTNDEKGTLLLWLNSNMESGDKVKNLQSILNPLSFGKTVKLSLPFIDLPANERDTFIIFSIPFSFPKTYNINRLQFKSKVQKYIHHINLFIGPSKQGNQQADFVYGYAPGMLQTEFSDDQGFVMPLSGFISGDIHIPPLNHELKLDLQFIFQVANKPLLHKLIFIGNRGFKIENMPSLMLPHDSIICVRGKMPIDKDVYLTHIMPHMHLLGKKIKVWVTDSLGNTSPLIRINEWQFNWQNFYEFIEPVSVTAGSTIMVEAVYDNTKNNPLNPNNPPIDVREGWLASQEMLSVFMLGYYPNPK